MDGIAAWRAFCSLRHQHHESASGLRVRPGAEDCPRRSKEIECEVIIKGKSPDIGRMVFFVGNFASDVRASSGVGNGGGDSGGGLR